jgi:hypothetical protein
VSTYQAQVGGTNLAFDSQAGTLIRLDACQNDACQRGVAVVYDPQGQVIDTYPALDDEPDELLPEDVKVAFRQALRSLNEKIWDGCVLMCRRALEEATRQLGAEGRDLYNKIDDLASKGRITPDLRDWAHEARLGGKLGAHGEDDKKWNTQSDAEELVEFSKWFFRYVYILPKQLDARRSRLRDASAAAQTTEVP